MPSESQTNLLFQQELSTSLFIKSSTSFSFKFSWLSEQPRFSNTPPSRLPPKLSHLQSNPPIRSWNPTSSIPHHHLQCLEPGESLIWIGSSKSVILTVPVVSLGKTEQNRRVSSLQLYSCALPTFFPSGSFNFSSSHLSPAGSEFSLEIRKLKQDPLCFSDRLSDYTLQWSVPSVCPPPHRSLRWARAGVLSLGACVCMFVCVCRDVLHLNWWYPGC